jgi:hypothetical protein
MGRFADLQQLIKGYLGYGNKMGEGWLLTAEMLELIHTGTNNIVCTQPFGCLPNHVVGKGMIRALKDDYPDSNIVAIDFDPELHSARYQADPARLEFHDAELGNDAERTLLRDDQHFAVGVHKQPALHALGCAIEVDCYSLQVSGVAVDEHGHHPVDEILALGKVLWRIPAQPVGCQRLLRCPRHKQPGTRISYERSMVGGWPHPVEPASSILVARHGERRSRQLLGVKPVGWSLGRVAALRQGAFDRLALEVPA